MQKHCPALASLRTIGGVCRRLTKWRIGSKRARLHLVSPDPDFDEKQHVIAATLAERAASPEGRSVLYGDEFTFYRQPTLGRAYHEQGKKQPTVPFLGRANTKRRIAAALDVATGQVHWLTRKVVGLVALRVFLKALRGSYDALYGPCHRVILIWDNWPIHYHPVVTEAAREQRIELLFVPTYAPWTNPIEKFWDKLKDQELRLHRSSQQWEVLCQRVEQFLTDHDKPRPDLLKRVGLARDKLQD
jgi:putative transposase